MHIIKNTFTGALYSWYHEYGFLDLTMPIVRTGITVIAPVPKYYSFYTKISETFNN